MKSYWKIIIVVVSVLALSVFLTVIERETEPDRKNEDVTWEEFEAMTAEQQIAFQNSFGSAKAFDKWLQRVHPKIEETESGDQDFPWENGGKQPSEYTWEEFEALSAGQQMAFQRSFGSVEAFDAWLQRVHPENQETESGTLDLPWENGGKQPSEYTWEEFEALSGGQQIAFQNSFDSMDAFDAWLQRVHPENQETESGVQDLPWENGGKQPSEYTWEEFETLSAEQQTAFQNSFGSVEAFDEWLQRVNPQ